MNLSEEVLRIKQMMISESDKNKTSRFVKCVNCNKKFTQTIHKGKKSTLECPHCGTHNKEEEKEGAGAYAAPAFQMEPDHTTFKHEYNENLKVDSWGRLHDEEKKILYPFKKVSKFVEWFQSEFGKYAASQGWSIFDSDTDIPNVKYKHEPTNSRKSYFQVQRLDDPEEGEAQFGRLKNDYQADELAKKLGIMIDEYGVVIGWDGNSFLN